MAHSETTVRTYTQHKQPEQSPSMDLVWIISQEAWIYGLSNLFLGMFQGFQQLI